MVTLVAPPDWPKMVTLPGSPPNTEMFCLIHDRAADNVLHSHIAGVRPLLAAQIREIQKAEQIQTMIDADNHDVFFTRKIRSVV